MKASEGMKQRERTLQFNITIVLADELRAGMWSDQLKCKVAPDWFLKAQGPHSADSRKREP